MSTTTRTLQAIKFDRDNIKLKFLINYSYLIRQVISPSTTSKMPLKAIKLMQVRGAPAIAIVGAFSVVVEVSNYLKQSDSNQKLLKT